MSDLIAIAYPDQATALPEVSGYGGEVLQTSLNDEGERRLQEALSSGASPAADAS